MERSNSVVSIFGKTTRVKADFKKKYLYLLQNVNHNLLYGPLISVVDFGKLLLKLYGKLSQDHRNKNCTAGVRRLAKEL